jgi:hypothetical protein
MFEQPVRVDPVNLSTAAFEQITKGMTFGNSKLRIFSMDDERRGEFN